jgi:Tfp pilus assembly protein PilF
VALLGQVPTKTAVIDIMSVIQWCLYYPAVLDVAELDLDAAAQAQLRPSLLAYVEGDLLRAVSAYPADLIPRTNAERIYAAALLLAVGQVDPALQLLDAVEATNSAREQRLAASLRLMVAVVQQRLTNSPARRAETKLATESLAESYYLQSHAQLDLALAAARRATVQSPGFAFAWAHVAELEFSRGRITRAMAALERSLALAPRNAQALALQGFLLSARNRTAEALAVFDQAIALDGGLGNAWLGRGLCRIRHGDAEAGRLDLQIAAATEPQRSLLRSYLGKAFNNAGDDRRADTELGIAKQLDPGDPTPWLYSALLEQQGNRVNQAVQDLERSQDLNDNRRIYRSGLLLDQDRAVRGANLATIYRDAGMIEVSAAEAGRAVNADYANYSAHLFLANSFNQLRDLKQINLRYESAWFSEYLVANLLAPVGAGTLSQSVSQQEYSKLFERDRLGITSSTEYFSHGEWIQSAAQYGIFGNSSYAAEVFYHHAGGIRPNNDLTQLATVLNFKQQLTPQDHFYLRGSYYNAEGGDVNDYYDQAEANLGLRTRERQEPTLLAGYHHEWNPGSHTLFLAGRLQDTFEVKNANQRSILFNRGFGGPVAKATPLTYEQDYQSDLEIFTGEVQQLWQHERHTFVVGGRIQSGGFDSQNSQVNGVSLTDGPLLFTVQQDLTADFDRQTLYAYDHWQLFPSLLLAAGISYDRVHYPENYRFAPLNGRERTRDQFSPKAGIIYTPHTNTTIRAAWFRALGGVSLDQSVRLEPSQVAGFNQAYRSLIPESVAGANAVPSFESWSVSVEQRLHRRTYLTLLGEIHNSEVRRQVGVVDLTIPFLAGPIFSTGTTRQNLDYRERSVSLTLNQLLGDRWSLGARYRISQAELLDRFPDITGAAAAAGQFVVRQDLEARLQQAQLFAIYNHECGFFAGAGGIWTQQNNSGYTPSRPGDDFFQFNIEAGWRFARRRVEVRLALLNLADQDYRLNPLNLTPELPRERTLAASLRFNF